MCNPLNNKGKYFFVLPAFSLWKCIREKYTVLTSLVAHASLDSIANST